MLVGFAGLVTLGANRFEKATLPFVTFFDESVQVAIYRGAVSGGGEPVVASDGTLASGQTFDTLEMLAPPTDGDVFAGRLRVRWPGEGSRCGSIPWACEPPMMIATTVSRCARSPTR